MPSLLRSTLILAFARTTNFALVIFSPIILVRVLDPVSFGQYREFLVFAMLITSIASFNIKANLLYFIPSDPAHTKLHVSHTNLMTFIAAVGTCAILYILRDFLLANTSLDFFFPLIIYIFLFLNLDSLESYWLAKGQADFVMYFSIGRTIVRLCGVIGTAILTKSVVAMMYALCTIEAARLIVVGLIMMRAGILKPAFNKHVLQSQLSFVVPLGLSGSLHYVSQYVGQIAISVHLGVVALAIYTVANFQVPILNIVRGAIGDSIFPDMVRQAADHTVDRLSLWKRANIAYTFLIVPFFAIVTWYADVLIPWVFTDEYSDAVPIFRVLALFMLTQCFEFSSPLRAIHQTRVLLMGNVWMLTTNVAMILIFFEFFSDSGIYGPAVGVVVGNVVQTVYFGWQITKFYSIPLSRLLKWRSLYLVMLCTLAACVPLLAGEYLALSDNLRVPTFSFLFAIVYYATIRYVQLDEVETLMKTLTKFKSA